MKSQPTADKCQNDSENSSAICRQPQGKPPFFCSNKRITIEKKQYNAYLLNVKLNKAFGRLISSEESARLKKL
jgi:hypothetical protein